MFIKTTVFKKMLNEAYKKGGFTVGNDNGEIFVEGGTWVLRVNEENLPNKEKAHIIELGGELPAEGEVYKCQKGGPNQYAIPWNDIWDIGRAFRESEVEFGVTDITLQSVSYPCRILQEKATGKCIVMQELYYNLIDPDQSDRQTETEPEGPMARNTDGTILYWKNNIMSLALCTMFTDEQTKTEALLQYLSKMKLWKERNE